MKVYLCWSGELSRDIGNVIKSWLPSVLQTVKPYFTPEDIEKGTRWFADIAKELEDSHFGILVVTRENIASTWMMFEAGALSKQMEKSNICPILFGLENTDLQGPLVQFQATCFNKDDFMLLMTTMSNACGEGKLESTILQDTFNMWWPQLEERINTVIKKHEAKKRGSEKVIRTDRDLLEETLTLTRAMARSAGARQDEIVPMVVGDLRKQYKELSEACKERDYEAILNSVERMKRPVSLLRDIVMQRNWSQGVRYVIPPVRVVAPPPVRVPPPPPVRVPPPPAVRVPPPPPVRVPPPPAKTGKGKIEPNKSGRPSESGGKVEEKEEENK